MKKWFLYSCLFLLACEQEVELYIEPELQPYFDTFIAEAEARGLSLDLQVEEVEGYIESLDVEGLMGKCVHDNLLPEKIVIDQSFWDDNDQFSREFIVFHELGHCLLDRGHLDDTDKGKCISIMHSGARSCRLNYKESTRSTYLDELFSM